MNNLKSQVLHGIKWSFFAKLIAQVFSWISTFFVMRMLSPEDYGVVAIAMVFFTFIVTFTSNSFISALVRIQEVDGRVSDAIFTISLAINLLLSISLASSANLIAGWYNNELLKDVVVILALTAPLASLTIVPTAKLQIDMKFKAKSICEAIAGFSATIVAFTMAFLDMAYWALIVSNCVFVLIRVISLNLIAKSFYKVSFDFSNMKETLLFSMRLQLGSAIWFVSNKGDTFLIGRYLGVAQAGIYNVANEIASLPMTKINSIMNEVAFSAFAKTKSDIAKANSYLSKAIKMLSVITFPVFFGISVVSGELVIVLLGDKWASSIPIISILCLVIPFRMMLSVMSNYSNGLGESKFGLNNAYITSSLLLASVFAGVQYGLFELAILWSTSVLISYLIILVRYIRKFKLEPSQLLVFTPVLIISILMYCFVFFVSEIALENTAVFGSNIMLLLTLKIISGILFSAPPLVYFYGKEFRELFGS